MGRPRKHVPIAAYGLWIAALVFYALAAVIISTGGLHGDAGLFIGIGVGLTSSTSIMVAVMQRESGKGITEGRHRR